MSKQKYYKQLDKVYSSQFKLSFKTLKYGQIKYHFENFSTFFNEKLEDFKKFNILETGAGPGVHATILSLMGANVMAADILNSNIQKIKKFKIKYKLLKLKVKRHDFTKKFKSIINYNFISCHNWIQHSRNPSLALKNLVKYSKMNTKLYISCYHAKTFRFFITYIARKILKPEDLDLLKKRTKVFFPGGFNKYKNPDNIYGSNIIDDFFSPFVITIDYKNFSSIARNYGLKIYLKKLKIITKKGKSKDIDVPNNKNLYFMDDAYLKVGMKKISQSKCENPKKLFLKPYNEFLKTDIEIVDNCIILAKEVIKIFKNQKLKSLDRVDFCLGMYKIRAQNNKESGMRRYQILKNFLLKRSHPIKIL